MGHLKTTMILVASLVLPAILALAGCGEDHGDRFRGERDRSPERYERHDGDRPADRDAGPARDRGDRGER